MIKLTMYLFTHCLCDLCVGAIQGIINIKPGDKPIVTLCCGKYKKINSRDLLGSYLPCDMVVIT